MPSCTNRRMTQHNFYGGRGISRVLLSFMLATYTMWDTCSAFNPLGIPHPANSHNKRAMDSQISVARGVPMTVPWFPMSKSDLDVISQQTLDAGADLDSDHPGFKDMHYRQRRKMIVDEAAKYKHGDRLPVVDYTSEEVDTWGHVYDELRKSANKHGITPYNEILSDMENCGVYGTKTIPQIQDVSEYLKGKTGFTLRPIGGLLTPRDFLNGLAFKIFHSTQYIRHHSKPLYTPEPDIVHELVGHAPMLAEPDFAALSQSIGLASLAASDEDIVRLATVYWFSVEFGLCLEGGRRKAYGAGLLSSIGELEYACGESHEGGTPELRPFNPTAAAEQAYPITTYQPVYYVADSLSDAEAKIRSFGESISSVRQFKLSYDESKGLMLPDIDIVRLSKGGASASVQ